MLKKIKEFLFHNKTTKQTVVKNAFWISVGVVLGRIIRAFFIVYAARILGAAEYGIFSYALGISAFFTLFGDLGLASLFTREASQHPEQRKQYFATTFFMKVVLSSIAGILLIITTPLFSRIQEIHYFLFLLALLVIADNMREFLTSMFRTIERMELEALVALITNIAITLSGFLVLYLHPSLRALIIAYVGSSSLGFLFALFLIRKDLINIIKNFNNNYIKPFMFSAIPFALAGILGALTLNTDLVILGWMRTAKEIGLYSAGQKIVFIIYMLPSIFGSAIFPTLSRLVGKKEQEAIQSLIRNTMVVIYSLAFPILIGGILLGSSIFTFLYNQEYMDGVLSFQILIATIIFAFPGGILGNVIFAHNKQKSLLLFSVIIAVGNLILDIIFIRLWGIAGCSLATLLMQILYNVMVWRLTKKIITIPIFSHLKKIITASIVMGIVSFIMNVIGVHVVVNIILSAMIYFLTLIMLKEKIISEIRSILKFS